MMAPFILSFEELGEKIDRAERDGVCSGEAVKAARQEFEELSAKLCAVIIRKVRLQNWIRAAENASK
jgi:hypothetical protein